MDMIRDLIFVNMAFRKLFIFSKLRNERPARSVAFKGTLAVLEALGELFLNGNSMFPTPLFCKSESSLIT